MDKQLPRDEALSPLRSRSDRGRRPEPQGDDTPAAERLGPEQANEEWRRFYEAVRQGMADLRYEEK